jgi:hypothetical protein
MKRTVLSAVLGLTAAGSLTLAATTPAFADADSGAGTMAATAATMYSPGGSGMNTQATISVSADGLPCFTSLGVPTGQVRITVGYVNQGRVQALWEDDHVATTGAHYLNGRYLCSGLSVRWTQTMSSTVVASGYVVVLSGSNFSHERDIPLN